MNLVQLLINGISGSTPLIQLKIEKIKIDRVNKNIIAPNSDEGNNRIRYEIIIKLMSRSNA